MLSQKQITKRIIGQWLHKRGITPIARMDGSYKLDRGFGHISFKVYDNGNIIATRFYSNMACKDHAGDLAGLIRLATILDEE